MKTYYKVLYNNGGIDYCRTQGLMVTVLRYLSEVLGFALGNIVEIKQIKIVPIKARKYIIDTVS